jgi:hypothetical protein
MPVRGTLSRALSDKSDRVLAANHAVPRGTGGSDPGAVAHDYCSTPSTAKSSSHVPGHEGGREGGGESVLLYWVATLYPSKGSYIRTLGSRGGKCEQARIAGSLTTLMEDRQESDFGERV